MCPIRNVRTKSVMAVKLMLSNVFGTKCSERGWNPLYSYTIVTADKLSKLVR